MVGHTDSFKGLIQIQSTATLVAPLPPPPPPLYWSYYVCDIGFKTAVFVQYLKNHDPTCLLSVHSGKFCLGSGVKSCTNDYQSESPSSQVIKCIYCHY